MLTANMRREYEETSSNCAGWELEDRKAAFEWLVAFQNGLSSTGHGLERYQHTAEELVHLVNCEDWEGIHTCIDNGSDGVSATQSVADTIFKH